MTPFKILKSLFSHRNTFFVSRRDPLGTRPRRCCFVIVYAQIILKVPSFFNRFYKVRRIFWERKQDSFSANA